MRSPRGSSRFSLGPPPDGGNPERPADQSIAVPFRINELTEDAIEDVVAYWLYFEGEEWELWRLVPGSQTLSPGGRVLRVALELEGERFELALIEAGSRLTVKFDDREDPEQEIPAHAFESDGDVLVAFETDSERVFVLLELAA